MKKMYLYIAAFLINVPFYSLQLTANDGEVVVKRRHQAAFVAGAFVATALTGIAVSKLLKYIGFPAKKIDEVPRVLFSSPVIPADSKAIFVKSLTEDSLTISQFSSKEARRSETTLLHDSFIISKSVVGKCNSIWGKLEPKNPAGYDYLGAIVEQIEKEEGKGLEQSVEYVFIGLPDTMKVRECTELWNERYKKTDKKVTFLPRAQVAQAYNNVVLEGRNVMAFFLTI